MTREITDWYFAYGMLTNPDFMERAQFMGPARLTGYRPEMLQFANVVPDRDHEFLGVLWGIDRQILRELDQIEGYPDFYLRHHVRVYPHNTPAPVEAWVYMMTPSSRLGMADRAPGRNYLRSVESGYRHAGISLPF